MAAIESADSPWTEARQPTVSTGEELRDVSQFDIHAGQIGPEKGSDTGIPDHIPIGGESTAPVAEPTATSLEAAQNYLAAVDQGMIEGDPAQVAKHRAFVLPHSKLDDHSKTTVDTS